MTIWGTYQNRLYVFLDFSMRELEVIRLRVQGMSMAEIARQTLATVPSVQSLLRKIYRKSGVHSRRELKAWAVEHCLDVPTPPDTLETRAVPILKKRRNTPIRLGRIRRYNRRNGAT